MDYHFPETMDYVRGLDLVGSVTDTYAVHTLFIFAILFVVYYRNTFLNIFSKNDKDATKGEANNTNPLKRSGIRGFSSVASTVKNFFNKFNK